MKLPELNPVRGVPTLVSPKAAGLPNKLRNISAGVAASRQVSNTLMAAAESESKLDATRRMNAAQREYTQRATELTQDFHSNRDRPLSEYGAELESLRESVLTTASDGAGYMTRDKLARASDQYRTKLQQFELDAVQKLTESRMVMNLTDIARDNLQTVGEDGDVEGALAAYTEAVNATTLDAQVKQSEIIKYNSAAATTAVGKWVDDGDLASLTGFVYTESFKRLSPSEQSNIQAAIAASTKDILSEDFNTAQHQLAIGNWTPERGWAFVDSSVDAVANLTDSQRASMKEAYRLDMGTSYISGLLAAGQDQQVVDVLTSDKYVGKFDATRVASWLNSARAGANAGRDASATMINYQLDDEITKATNGTAYDEAVVAAAHTLLPSLSTSGQAGVQIRLAKLGEFAPYAPLLAAAPTQSSENLTTMAAQLAGRENEVLADATAKNYDARLSAVRGAQKTVQAHLKQREDAPVSYAISNDPMANKTWTEFQAGYQLLMSDAEDAPTQDEVSTLYSAYKANVLRAQNLYGIREADQRTVPENPNLLTAISKTIVEGTAQEQRQAINTAVAILGDDAADIAGQLMDSDPTAAFLMAYGTITDMGGVEAMTTGNNIRQSGAAPKLSEFKESLTVNGVVVPYAALGDLNKAANDAIFTYAVGIADPSEIESGQFTEETLTAARNAVIGEPITLNPYAQPTLTYRDAANQWVPAETVKAQFRSITWKPEDAAEVHGKPQLRDLDGTLKPADWRDVMTFATPTMVRNGVYQLSLPRVSPLGSAGLVLNEEGEPFELDLLSTPAPSDDYVRMLNSVYTDPLAVDQLQGNR